MVPPAMIDSAPFNVTKSHSLSPKGNGIPRIPFHVNIAADNRHDQLVQVVKLICPLLDSGVYQSQPLTGGLSNELFVVSKGSQAVLVRIHPYGESIVNHQEESRILAWLSQQGDAPKLYGLFRNGRIEQFLQDYFPLSYSDMPRYTVPLARHMANLHRKEVPCGVLSTTSKSVWNRIDTWFDMALERSCDPELSTMLIQWNWVKDQLVDPFSKDPTVAFTRQTVFCHMDLQSLNILKKDKEETLRIIDYEYAGMHPRAVDIANTWLEYCDMNNLKANYRGDYPSEDQQNDFLREYLLHTQPTWKKEEKILMKLRMEIGKHTLVSHIGWAVWGFLQSYLSNIGFDYKAYARHRMEGYYIFRTMFFDNNNI
jgi:thiamine kinase-like enzyme